MMKIISPKKWSLGILFASILGGSSLSAAVNIFPIADKNTSSISIKKKFAGITANGDAAAFNANGMEVDVIANDRIDGNNNIVLNGVSPNASIEKLGNWPSGIYLSANGKLIVVAGTIMPRQPLRYRLKHLGTNETSTAQIILYDNSNVFTNESFYIWTEVDGTCYTSNANERKFTLHIVNIGATSRTIAANNESGFKFRINATGVDYSSSNTDDPLWEHPSSGIWYYKALKNRTTVPSFGEITFNYKKSNISGDETSVSLTSIRVGNMSANEIGGSPGTAITFGNLDEKKIYKTPSVPTSRTITGFIGHNMTPENSVSLANNTSINDYRFYRLENGNYIEIPKNYPFQNATTGTTTYYYTRINSQGCESARATITVTVNSTNDATGGTINIESNNSSEITICKERSVRIKNITNGTVTNPILYAKYYSWEISTNNGVNWMSLSESDGQDFSYITVNAQLRTELNINNIKETIWLRRKTTRVDLINNPYAYSNIVKINIQQNSLSFPNNTKSFAVSKGSTFTLPVITPQQASQIKFYDQTGTEVTSNTLTMNQKGSFYYTVVATSNDLSCVTSEIFEVIVYDAADCNTIKKKTYATKAITWTSGLSATAFGDEAILDNNAGYATLSGGVVLLGLGTVGIDLYFEKSPGVLYTPSELKGKKITLKLGEQYSGLKVAGGLSVVGRATTATSTSSVSLTNSSNSGFSMGVKGGVLDALKGDNVFTFSFVPKDISGNNVNFNGVRIQLGSLLGVADLATVFYAYIEDEETVSSGSCSSSSRTVTPYLYHGDGTTKTPLYPTTQTDINGNVATVANQNIQLNSFVDDVTWGNRTEVLNVASSLSSIVHPYFAVDNDYNSYCLFNSTVGVLNQQFLQVHLKQKAQPGDQVRIVLSYPNINLINLSLLQLGNFKLVYYLGDAMVGEDPLEEFRVLDVGLFNWGSHRKAVLAKPIRMPFDRIELRQFQTINVNIGDGLHVYDIRVQPLMLFEGQMDPKQVVKLCAADPIGIQKPDLCTTYNLSLSKVLTWGNQLTDENGNLLYEADGVTPVRSITSIQDIPGSNLAFRFQKNNTSGTFTDYYDLSRLYKSDENDGILLLKVQSIRQGCPYGDPEYLRIRLSNCRDALANPMLRIFPGVH